MSRQSSEQSSRYAVRWMKTGDSKWQTLKVTDNIVEARAWRDQWRKSSNCADIMIYDRLKREVTA